MVQNARRQPTDASHAAALAVFKRLAHARALMSPLFLKRRKDHVGPPVTRSGEAPRESHKTLGRTLSYVGQLSRRRLLRHRVDRYRAPPTDLDSLH
jgi:hypothetical protein